MTWFEVALLAAVLIGAVAGTVLVTQRPQFWIGLGTEVTRRVMPEIMRVMFGRMPPEQEKAWRECIRRGGKWDHVRKRCDR